MLRTREERGLEVRLHMDLRWLGAIRMEVCDRAAPTYEQHMPRMATTAAARPHVYWVGEDPATQELVRGWPVGPALLETLGALNSDVDEALARERASLSENGYPEDLPLPALWWKPRALELVDVSR